MKKMSLKKVLSIFLTLCMIISLCPLSVFADTYKEGDVVTTYTEDAPEDVDGYVWELTDSYKCLNIEHTHSDSCYYKSCDHKDGHLSSCYSESTAYALCTHEDPSEHTGDVTLTDVITISGTDVSWTQSHPAYSVVKAEYDKGYAKNVASVSGTFAQGLAFGKFLLSFSSTKFCYTVSSSSTPDLCMHVCSDVGGDCYTKLCILSEHTHTPECADTWTWTLKADINGNGVADDSDTYYNVKYVDEDGIELLSESVLTGMPTPSVAEPEKAADAQYTYTFTGWSPEVSEKVTADVTYTATYSSVVNKYTVTWLDEDGSLLEKDENVEYGAMPSFDGPAPTKDATADKTYTFAGWTPEVLTVTGDAVYTATYSEKNVYTVTFKSVYNSNEYVRYVVDGEKVTAPDVERENYTLTGWYADEALTNEYDINSSVEADTVLYAKWTPVNDTNNDNIADEEQNNSVYVTAYNASVVINNEECVSADAALNSSVSVSITPDEGYAVEWVVINGERVDVNYSGCTASFDFNVGVSESYEVIADVKACSLNLNVGSSVNKFDELDTDSIFNAIFDSETSNPVLTSEDVTVEYLALSVELLGKTYEYWVAPGTDVSVDSFLESIGLSSISSTVVSLLGDNVPHLFGDEDVETVKVSFAGNDKYAAMSATGNIIIGDYRTASEVVLNESVSLTYYEEITAEDVYNAVFAGVNGEDGEAIAVAYGEDMSISIDSLNAGTHTVTIKFAGNREYSDSEASVDVTIEKANASVTVDAANVKYGNTVNVSSLIDTGAAEHVEIAVGFDFSQSSSDGIRTVAYVNFPGIVDLDSIENETLRSYVEKALDSLASGGEMTISDLKSALESVLSSLESLESSDVSEYIDINISTETINAIIYVLDSIEDIDLVNDMVVCATFGQEMMLENTGVYLVAGVVSDANYNTSLGVNYAIIYPDGYKAELDWNIVDENGFITIDALNGGYDLGAHVSGVYEGTVEEAESHLITLFAGVDTDGNVIVTADQSELSIGAYTEISFVYDFGSTMYYAQPIVRVFAVVSDLASVKFIDENGDENNDRKFVYNGEAHAVSAVVYDRQGNELDAAEQSRITYTYIGARTDGSVYYGSEAPTECGIYTVVALYSNETQTVVGMGVSVLAITPAEAPFSLEDVTVTQDSESHYVKVNNELGLDYITVIVDENNNVNIILPESWEVDTLRIDISGGLDAVLAEIDKLESYIPAVILEQYSETIAEIKAQLTTIFESADVSSVTVNGDLPSADGIYRVVAVAFGNYNYQIAVDDAVLVIEKVVVEEPSIEEETSTEDEPSTEEPSTEEPSSEEPSTEEPSSEEPSTEEPSTEESSTEEPSTEEPSTEEPSTEEPSTEEPSTEEPSTEKPSTEKPSTEKPSTEKPSTEEPSTEKPSTEKPSTEEPSTEEPSTEKPSTEEPSTEEPSTEEPSIEKPSTEEPSTEKPSTEKPSTEEPSTEEPSTEEPSTEKPSTEEPSTEKPSTEEPSTEEPIVNNKLLGDVNLDGVVNAADARLALRISARIDPMPDSDSVVFYNADVIADNKIVAADARLILRVSAHLDSF